MFKTKQKHHTVLPTCSRQLRRQLRPAAQHVLLPVLPETVVTIIVHVVIFVLLVNTDGGGRDSGKK